MSADLIDLDEFDELSVWTLPPPSARDAKSVRAFNSAEEALAFLARYEAQAAKSAQAA